MIVEIYMSGDTDRSVNNGINLKINRCDGDDECTIWIEDDGGKPLIESSFEIKFSELKKAIYKLEFRKE